VNDRHALSLINDLTVVHLAVETLENPDSTPAERATASRLARHHLRGTAETIRRLARSQESALGKRLSA
jgi:hypothetical protein